MLPRAGERWRGERAVRIRPGPDVSWLKAYNVSIKAASLARRHRSSRCRFYSRVEVRRHVLHAGIVLDERIVEREGPDARGPVVERALERGDRLLLVPDLHVDPRHIV